MKKIIAAVLAALTAFVFVACAGAGDGGKTEIKKTYEGDFCTYDELSDGTWQANGIVYRDRLEIRGRLPNAAADSVYVYLSNIGEISFERAWKASGLSSDLGDYFDPTDALLVEMRIVPNE